MDISIWFFNEPIVQSNAIVHVCQDLEWQIIMEKANRFRGSRSKVCKFKDVQYFQKISCL